MRHFWIALSIPLLVATAAAQAPLPKPGPEQKRLEVFVGDWTFEGEFSLGTMGQGGKVTGTETSRMLGGFFVERHFQEKGPSGSRRRGVHVFGFDPVKKTYITSDFDSTGGFGSGTVSVSGRTWTFSEARVNAGRPIHNRCVLTFAPGNRSFTAQCNGSTDGKKWAPSFVGRWTKSR